MQPHDFDPGTRNLPRDLAVGQSLGAKKPERAEEAVRVATKYDVAFMTAIGLVFFGLICYGSVEGAMHAWTSNEFEGEGAMHVSVRDGVVERVELEIYEPPRFFEAFLRGRAYTEPPDITARICGICPVAYQTSACNAIEELEATARLALLTRGLHPRLLTDPQVQDLVTTFNVEWDA